MLLTGGKRAAPFSPLATELGLTETATRMAAIRLRQEGRYPAISIHPGRPPWTMGNNSVQRPAQRTVQVPHPNRRRISRTLWAICKSKIRHGDRVQNYDREQPGNQTGSTLGVLKSTSSSLSLGTKLRNHVVSSPSRFTNSPCLRRQILTVYRNNRFSWHHWV